MVPVPIGSATSIKSELERHVLLLLYIKELLRRYQMLIHFSNLKWDKNLETVCLKTLLSVLALCPVSSLCFCGVTRTGWMWFPCTMNYTVSSFIAPPVTVISTFCWCLAGCNLTFSTPKLKTQAFPGDMRNLFWRQQTIVQFYTEWQWKKVLSFQLYYPRILQCGYIYIISKKYLDF